MNVDNHNDINHDFTSVLILREEFQDMIVTF